MTAPGPSRGRAYTGAYAANLRPVETVLMVLATTPGEWHKVDEWPKDHWRTGGSNSTSALTIALRRRGADVAVRTDATDADHWSCYARWTHALPIISTDGTEPA